MSPTQREIELGERITRNEEQIKHIIEGWTQFLENWNSQWKKIDDLKLEVDELKSTRNFWKRLLAPVAMILVGIIIGLGSSLSYDLIKERIGKTGINENLPRR